MNDLDYIWNAEHFHKIRTKIDGVQPFDLRHYQKRFVEFVNAIEGPKRVVVVKPRQAGFTTLCASIFSHRMYTIKNERVIAIADKFGRTLEMSKIYRDYVDLIDPAMLPMVAVKNQDEIYFDNPDVEARKKHPGMSSGIRFMTARDKYAGRAGTRTGAHLSEVGFFMYSSDIDEGIQNSIPLHKNTLIIRESTANGRQGLGAPFYELTEAARRGESIYKFFFVAWNEIEDYWIEPPRDFTLTSYEKEIMGTTKDLTHGHLMWRRLKVSEYLGAKDGLNFGLSPEERFKQDFPLNVDEAFLFSGSPIFPQDKIHNQAKAVRDRNPINLAGKVDLGMLGHVLKSRLDEVKILSPPRGDSQYFIGVDVSEGLAIGDSSAITVVDNNLNDAAYWIGKIDPDMLGHIVIDIAKLYNNAHAVVEKNNMGITTVITMKNEGYTNVFKKKIEDHITRKIRTELGWRTTVKSKQEMLNLLIQTFRDGDFKPRSLELLLEMGNLAREENGDVCLNGKDLCVSACLAIVGWKYYCRPEEELKQKSRELYDLGAQKKGNDLFG